MLCGYMFLDRANGNSRWYNVGGAGDPRRNVRHDVKHYKGVFPAAITPMSRKDGKVNEEAFRAVMEMNIRAGVDGFWTAGGTGESVYLTDEENRRIAEISADQNKGRTTVIMQVGAATTARAAKNAENAAKAGVEAICALPPHFFNPGHDAVVEYYRVVGAAANLPLFVYNLPIATGIEITPALMAKIKEKVPQLVGLKHASMDYGAMVD
ncbi:MAG: dihydrodipicolinate synthase family protein [SAR202 cluster bacterium]|nr:dihydrodipicolinate synthase family protein [SAR202 cluster bacterium]